LELKSGKNPYKLSVVDLLSISLVKMSQRAAKKKNVQAVVRVRPLSGQEIIEKARRITTVDPYSKMVNIRDKQAMKPFGPFDKVISTE
jgi:hypothetical protein